MKSIVQLCKNDEFNFCELFAEKIACRGRKIAGYVAMICCQPVLLATECGTDQGQASGQTLARSRGKETRRGMLTKHQPG